MSRIKEENDILIQNLEDQLDRLVSRLADLKERR